MRHALSLPRVPALAACVLVALLAWLLQQAPSTPVPDGASVSGFNAARAQAHVAALERAPRPTGGAANAQARDYLLAQLRALGLQPEVQVETAQSTSYDWMAHAQVVLATVHNIVVRKPGVVHAGGAAVLAMAHYDSDAATPGAADGASAAALLETLHVLQTGPPLDNDLLVVFTDGDAPAGLALGTRAFLQSPRWAHKIRVALRFDRAGNRGPEELVDAAHADGFALATWASGAPDPHGTSFLAELRARLPQHAAATALATDDFPVLQFAAVEGTLGPSGMHDLPQRLAGTSLQHEGDTMVALLRRFGNARLPAPAAQHGQQFFALPLAGSVHYGQPLAWALAPLAGALCIVCCVVALRARTAGADIAHAMFGLLFCAVPAIFAAWLCRETCVGLQARYLDGVMVDDAGVHWQLLGFLLVPAIVFIVLQRRLQRRLGTATVALGAMLACAIVLAGTCVRAPGASYLFTWPLLALQAAWLARTRGAPVAAAAALPALVLIAPMAYASLAFLSPAWLVLPAALVCLLAALCGPALALLAPRLILPPLLVATAACAAMAYAAAPRVPELPARNDLVYFKDTPSWQAYWMSPPVPLDAWTRQVFPNTMHPYLLPYVFGVTSMPVWYAAAPRDDAVAWPDLVVEKDERSPRHRHVEFRLRSKNRAPEIVVRLTGGLPYRASVDGRVLTDRDVFSWRLALHGMDDRDLHFALDFIGDPEFMVYVQERMPGLPQRDLPARPGGLPPLLPVSGTTVASDVLVFR